MKDAEQMYGHLMVLDSMIKVVTDLEPKAKIKISIGDTMEKAQLDELKKKFDFAEFKNEAYAEGLIVQLNNSLVTLKTT